MAATVSSPVPASAVAPAAALPAELTHRQARQALDALLAQLRSASSANANANANGNGNKGDGMGAAAAGAWVVDASALQVFDSSALAVLLECRRGALVAQQPFAVRGLPPALAGLAALYGVAELLA